MDHPRCRCILFYNRFFWWITFDLLVNTGVNSWGTLNCLVSKYDQGCRFEVHCDPPVFICLVCRCCPDQKLARSALMHSRYNSSCSEIALDILLGMFECDP